MTPERVLEEIKARLSEEVAACRPLLKRVFSSNADRTFRVFTALLKWIEELEAAP